MELSKFLESLSNAEGISGYEYNLNDLIRTEFDKYTDETTIDNLGNIISLKKGKGETKIMLAAHMDEIGLMVNYVEENGLLRFTSVGGFDPRTIVGQEVIVHGKDRNESIAKMKSALGEFVIDGIDTNIDFLYKILENENFVNNNYDTSFISKEF